MCGIAGILDKNGVNLQELETMCNQIRHRGPDDEGFFALNTDGEQRFLRGIDTVSELNELEPISNSTFPAILGFGHRRLSIIDLSVSGHQPMKSPRGCVMAFNGEVYNYLEIREQLIAKGETFTTDSDTEVVLRAYEVWGHDCVSKFIGMWAFSIYDPHRNEVFCSRDRFGIKPFYYYQKDGFFAFGSEVKSLLECKKVVPELAEANLQQYLVLGKMIDVNQTLYKGIVELPAGHNLVYNLDNHEANIKSYYDLGEAIAERQSGSLTIEDYQNQFQDAVNIHMRSDVEVGSCLSGGLDSSAIVHSCTSLVDSNKYQTFSAIFDQKEIDESRYIYEFVERIPGLKPNYTTPRSKGLWEDLDKMIWHQDLPIASTSMYAQWEVMKLANQNGIKVLLDGQGADESLGGYGFFTGSFLLQTLSEFKFGSFFRESSAIRKNRGVSTTTELARAFSHSLPGSLQLAIRKNRRIGSSLLNSQFGNELTEEVKRVPILNCFQHHSIRAVKYGLHELLRYEDRNSMAFSIESRVPFLDHRLVELSIAMPPTTKIQNGWTKYPLRNLLNGNIPDSIVWRRDKKGFATPQQIWKRELKNELADMIESNLSSDHILNKKALLEATKTELGSASAHSEYWKFISVIKWMKINGFNG